MGLDAAHLQIIVPGAPPAEETSHEARRAGDRRPSGRRRAGLRRHARPAGPRGAAGGDPAPDPRRDGDPRDRRGAQAEAEAAAPALGAVRARLPRLRRRRPAHRPGRGGRADRQAPRSGARPRARARRRTTAIPDHGRAHQLVEAACFYAGLRNRGAAGGSAAPAGRRLLLHAARPLRAELRRRRHRDLGGQGGSRCAPTAASSTAAHRPRRPRTGRSPRSRRRSSGSPSRGGPATSASRSARALGEPFWSRVPLAVADPMAILPGGVR